MGCCGQRREQLSRNPTPPKTATASPPATNRPAHAGPIYPLVSPVAPRPTSAAQRLPKSPSPSQLSFGPSVQVRSLEKSRIFTHGSATGRPYEFSAAQPFQSVDVRDAVALLRTRFFVQA